MIGASCAFHLARAGLRVIVVERAPAPGARQHRARHRRVSRAVRHRDQHPAVAARARPAPRVSRRDRRRSGIPRRSATCGSRRRAASSPRSRRERRYSAKAGLAEAVHRRSRRDRRDQPVHRDRRPRRRRVVPDRRCDAADRDPARLPRGAPSGSGVEVRWGEPVIGARARDRRPDHPRRHAAARATRAGLVVNAAGAWAARSRGSPASSSRSCRCAARSRSPSRPTPCRRRFR